MSLIDLISIKRQNLNERLNLLVKQYEAAYGQLNRELNDADKIRIQSQIDHLYQEMNEINEQLNALNQRTSKQDSTHQRRHWEEKLPQINFRRAWSQFITLFDNYVDIETGGAVLLLLPDYQTMCANLLVRRIYSWIQEKVGYTNVKRPLSIDILEFDELNSEQFLHRLGSYFDWPLCKEGSNRLSPLQLNDHAANLIAKMCDSLDRDEILPIEITVIPELYQNEIFLLWFLDEFWSPLVHKLRTIAREYNRPSLKCIITIMVDKPLPLVRPLSERYCTAEAFCDEHYTKLVPLPLTDWSEEEIHTWLRRHSGAGEQWTEQILREKAHAIYVRSRNGVPIRVRTQLVEMLNALVM